MARLLPYVATAALGLALAGAAFSNALGSVTVRSNPKLSARQLGASPVTELRTLDLTQLPKSSVEDRQAIVALAEQSLRVQALNPLALTALGLVADKNGHSAGSLKLLTDAHLASRRVLVTEIWLLEYYVGKDALADVLEQYDIVLRQSQDAQRLAFPVLDAALADPAIEQAFKPYISTATPWMAEFIGSSAATSPAPNLLAGTLLRTGTVKTALALKLELPVLFRRLGETGHVEMVQPLYRAAGVGPASLLTSVELNAGAGDPAIAPVSWRLAAQSNLRTEMLLGPNSDTIFNLKSSQATPQIALDKLLFLSPGRYRFQFDMERVSGDPGAARWLAICVGKSPSRVVAVSENTLVDDRVRALDFDVAPGCAAMQLVFEVTAQGDERDLEINLGKLRLERLKSADAMPGHAG